MHYVGSLSIHLAVPLGLYMYMCKGERVKQLGGLREQGCNESGRASQQLDTMLSCQMQKKFYNYNRGECSSMCGWAWACVCVHLGPRLVCAWLASGPPRVNLLRFIRVRRKLWPGGFCVCLCSANETWSPFASASAQQCARRALEQILSATYPPFYGCLSFTGAALMEF